MIKTRINNEYKDIIKIFGGGTLQKEITKIWSGEASKYVYESEVEYTGTLPITITANGNALLDYRIYGNTVQTGTPTPENPVDVVGCGVRTVNLFDLSSYYEVSSLISDIIIEKNRITYKASGQYLAIKYKFNLGIADAYTISLGADSLNTRLEIRYAKNGEFVGRAIIISPNQKTTVRGGNEYDEFLVFISNFTNAGICTASSIMLNLGSTALPYEPYGYKLPMTVSDGNTAQTVPIYLGEAETTRRIKKLVLTGSEDIWHKSATRNYSWYIFPVSIGTIENTPFYCSHGETVTSISDYTYGKVFCDNTCNLGIFDSSIDSVAKLNAYLAAQYAAGTPVTIWYVLKNPETGIVNEPLMKIGDYADTLSMEQADVSIPTIDGDTTIDYDGAPKPSQMYIKYRR